MEIHDQIRHALTTTLREYQEGRCGICGDECGTDMVLDHDHDNGLIRGYLCHGCNVQEGFHPHACDDMAGTSPTCPICNWRRNPAAARVGFTVAYRFGHLPVFRAGQQIADEYSAEVRRYTKRTIDATQAGAA